MIFDVSMSEDDDPDPQSEHFEYLRNVLESAQIDEWTIRRIDLWLDSEGKNFRIEKRNPGTLGANTRASDLAACEALLADGRRFITRLTELSIMPALNFRLLEAQSSNTPSTEEDFSLWQQEIGQIRAKLGQLMLSVERVTNAVQKDGSKGGRPRQSERNDIFVALCAQLKMAKADASNERLAVLAAQVFPRYVPGGAFSAEAALKILRNRL